MEILFLAVDYRYYCIYYKCINNNILLIIQSRSCPASLRSGPFSRSVPVFVLVFIVPADPDLHHSRSTRRSASQTRMRSSPFSSPSSSASTLPSASSPFHTTPLPSPSPLMSRLPSALPPSPSSRPSISASFSLPCTPPTLPPSSNSSRPPPPGYPLSPSASSRNTWLQCGLQETIQAFSILGLSGYAQVISSQTSDSSPMTCAPSSTSVRSSPLTRSFRPVPPLPTFRIPHPFPQLLLPLLLAYASSSKSDEFAHTSYLCAICLAERKGIHCLALSCGHIFCRACLVDMWGLHVKEGQVSHVGCPEPKCGKTDAQDGNSLREATEDEVSAVLSENELNRWKWLRKKRDLERDPTMIHCPIECCQEPVPKPQSDTSRMGGSDEDDSGWARLRTCTACGYSFCAFCRRTWYALTHRPCRSVDYRY